MCLFAYIFVEETDHGFSGMTMRCSKGTMEMVAQHLRRCSRGDFTPDESRDEQVLAFSLATELDRCQ